MADSLIKRVHIFFFKLQLLVQCVTIVVVSLLTACVVCVQVDSEEPVFEAVLNWVKHNRKEREPYLPDMLEFVRMPLLTPRYITDVIDAEVSQAMCNKLLCKNTPGFR